MDRKAIREAYGEELLELGRKRKEIVVLEADVGNSSRSIVFGKEFPERYFNVGIAEANMAAIAAGMATTGKIPFINAFAAFLELRAGDPIRSLISYMNLNVKIAGAYAGLSAAFDGATHHAITDIAFMRAIPNMTVVSVADAVETKKAIEAIVEYEGPVYIRLSKAELPVIFNEENYSFELGKAVQLTEGNDVTIFSTGCMTSKSLAAALQLRSKGIRARVVNIHTIKPLDKECIIKCAQETGAIATAEEHNIYGGLGGAISEVISQEYPVPLEIVGIMDCFTESGSYTDLIKKFGLETEDIEEAVKSVLHKKYK